MAESIAENANLEIVPVIIETLINDLKSVIELNENSKCEARYIRKENSVLHDLEKKRFIDPDFNSRAKRKNKSRELAEEAINLSVYKKKCGFITNRPLISSSS